MPELNDELLDDAWDENSEKSGEKSDKGKENDGDDGDKEKIKVGEKEIPVDELVGLVARGEEYSVLKKKYPSIEFGGLADDYTKKAQRLSDLEKIEKDKKEKEGKKNVSEKEELAKKQVLDILAPEFRKIVKEEIGSNSAVNKYEGTMEGLEKELDNKDGRPKFERKEIEKYMEEVGIANPKIAYEYKFREELIEWNKEHKKEGNIPFVESASGGGMKIPKPKKLESYEDAEKATEELLGR